MSPKAILLDFDGVIADTRNHHVVAWQRTLGFMGLTVADDVAARGAEADDVAFLTELFAAREIPVDKVEEWVERQRALVAELLRYAPRLYPGAVELIRALRGRMRLAVVCAARRPEVAAVLDASGMADAFERIVAAPEVARRPPDPQAHALALEVLGLPASSVAAVVGSPEALAAARAAGIGRLIAAGHRRPSGDWVGDAVFVEQLQPVERILEPLGFLDA